MKTLFLKSILLSLPLLLMLLVNTFFPSNDNCPQPITHSAQASDHCCSWACHDSTLHCKSNHLSHLKAHTPLTDPIYFGIIGALQTGGQYRLLNIAVLVIGLPFLMMVLAFRIIDQWIALHQIKR